LSTHSQDTSVPAARVTSTPDERTLSKRFGSLLPDLTSPLGFALFAFEGNTVLLFGLAYGVGLVGRETAVGVGAARRNPAP